MIASLSEAVRRQRLHDAVVKLEAAITAGDVQPTKAELQALQALCVDHQLYADAGRVRQWMGEP